MTAHIAKVYNGTLFETPERHTLTVIEDALIVVNENGVIDDVIDPKKDPSTHARVRAEAIANDKLITLKQHQYILPGLIDLHVHAPQWPQLGKALDCSLELWLQNYTFPLEAKYDDLVFARQSYESLVKTLLAHGTTTVAYFATIHLEASLLLGEICLENGQRAVIGRVAMDVPEYCPEYYRDPSAGESIRLSETFITRLRSLPGNDCELVLPAITPRFIPTCSDEALQGLGNLASRYKCHVLTHCSESDWEHNHVLNRCGMSDTNALDNFGLLTRQTILAHSVFVSDNDMMCIKERKAGIAHCPLSNFYFSDAVFPLRKALDEELHVGLGTDISGGPSASMWEACRQAITASRALSSGTDPQLTSNRSVRPKCCVDHIEAFYAATTNGGKALQLPIGRLAKGYYFDAVFVETNMLSNSLQIFDELDSLKDVFQKIVYNANASNILETYVNGRLVYKR